MGKLAELYDRMVVTAKSPDKSITLSVTGRGTLTVELAPDITRTHTEESLERQLNGLIRVAIAAFQQAQKQAYDRAVGPE